MADDFFAGLREEHARIEARLQTLDQAAARLERAEDDASALAQVAETLDFFAGEGALHEAHEEQTLFPRLRPLSEFRQLLSALEFQHRMNATEERALAACVAGFGPGKGRELRHLAYRFAFLQRGHALAEERALFQLAADRLGPQVCAEMLREMRARSAPARSP